MNSKITIAVDGYAACGKSTLAKALAKGLNYVYVDSGAMYRAVTLYCLDQQIDWNVPEQIEEALKNIHIEFRNKDGKNHTYLNGQDVENSIREMRVSRKVSPVSTISAVRRFLVQRQQQMGMEKGIVMDGRDIGTVVFPNAELKLFMTASVEVRTQRRLKEWLAKGVEGANAETVQQNLLERDHIDSTREDSPLKQAEDSIVIDNSDLSPEEQFQVALKLAKQCIEKKTHSLVK